MTITVTPKGRETEFMYHSLEAYHYAVAQGYFGTEWTADIAGQTIEEG